MTVKELLDPYAYFTLGVLISSLAVKFFRIIRLALAHDPTIKTAFKHPSPPGYVAAIRQTIYSPMRQFHLKANKTWTRGYAFYHIAIILLLLGYALSALILAGKMIAGHPIPDVESGTMTPESSTPANLLAIIFGNAEVIQRRFLFGVYSSVFLMVTWAEIGCAVFGNCCLLLTLLGKRCGAVRGDLDDSSRGVRNAGAFSWQHLLVRFLIFSIIWLEILSRLEWMPGLVYYHAFAGLTLFLLLPFVYLRHIVFVPLALYLAVSKRRSGLSA